ncbi:MAG: DNA repair protein RecN [Porticoccaceae bacterium]|nr:DNA repair protein RecN [Porticoccaceae bacterium]
MLLSLNITNFTLVESLEVDFDTGMTAITGETGAGKSLTLDALAMALGDRADSDRIRHGTERAEVSALFDVDNISSARHWLQDNDFEMDGDSHCLLRRIFTREGRSRGYINGQPATMQQLQRLGEQLIDIHSQHQHQSLLRRDTYRTLVDDHGDHRKLATQVAQQYRLWRDTQNRLDLLSQQSSELNARRDLLSFQVEELNALGLAPGELESLEKQQALLANAEAILNDSHQLLALCSDDDNHNLLSSLNQACSLAAQIPVQGPQLQEVADMLTNARIQVEEASTSLRQYLDGIEVDPQQLAEMEQRLSDIYQLARKHRVQAEQLTDLHSRLQQELDTLCGGEQDIQQLQEQAEQQRQSYLKSARQLSGKRRQAAQSLGKAINTHLPELAMPGAQLSIELTPLAEAKASPHGLENIDFLIASNPGQPAKPLVKVASGGELSRISLAIQVVAAQHSTTPTLVFDEVDVGIGGTTADVVGRLLRQLGQTGKRRGQVICVTHQPQVASRAHHHLQVSKSSVGDTTHTTLNSLAQTERIDEVARMLGGARITEQTRTHAQEMLELATQ